MFPQLLKEIENELEMDKAQKVCLKWKKERQWCIKNGIDV